MRKAISLALAGTLAAATIAAGTVSADAHRVRGHNHHHGGNNAGAAIVFGLAAGALAGSLFAPYPAYPAYPAYAPYAPYPQPYGYAPGPARSPHSDWCSAQYQSYNHANNTWFDYHGRVRICYSPY